jgi:hypothetical protein
MTWGLRTPHMIFGAIDTSTPDMTWGFAAPRIYSRRPLTRGVRIHAI